MGWGGVYYVKTNKKEKFSHASVFGYTFLQHDSVSFVGGGGDMNMPYNKTGCLSLITTILTSKLLFLLSMPSIFYSHF